jgi:sigma-B regulation protein RsbU (phosphoserine phosphatase)
MAGLAFIVNLEHIRPGRGFIVYFFIPAPRMARMSTMRFHRRRWQEELEIVDRTMKAISVVTDPNKLVEIYWDGIGELLPIRNFLAASRRNMEAPHYVVTRSSRFTEHLNPWTQRDQLPHLSGGLVGEAIYANRPTIFEDLPSRLSPDDPAYAYLAGFQSAIALPQYDSGEGLNLMMMFFPPEIQLDPATIPMIHWQGSLFGRGTQTLVLRNQLSDALAAMDRELQVVGEIQKSLLPSTLPRIAGFDLAAYYHTSARAGGDYYDFFPLDDGAWGMFIADVSGHGTPAAVLMAITHALAHGQPRSHNSPCELLRHINEQLTRSYTSAGTFVTAFYVVLDPRTFTLTYASAGHNPPRLVRDGRILPLDKASSLPLGILADQHYGQATVTMEKGDLLLLYTDGITETAAVRRAGAPRVLFGIDQLDRILLDCGGATAQGCIDRVCDAVAGFSHSAPPTDDQTLIAIRRH